jgi:hypothetical protein
MVSKLGCFFRGKGLGTDELPDTVSLNCSSMIFTDVLIGWIAYVYLCIHRCKYISYLHMIYLRAMKNTHILSHNTACFVNIPTMGEFIIPTRPVSRTPLLFTDQHDQHRCGLLTYSPCFLQENRCFFRLQTLDFPHLFDYFCMFTLGYISHWPWWLDHFFCHKQWTPVCKDSWST